jgi:hypothetical protein
LQFKAPVRVSAEAVLPGFELDLDALFGVLGDEEPERGPDES